MKPKNYSTDAAQEFSLTLMKSAPNRETDRANVARLVECLQSGVAFALPDHGMLIERPRKIGNVSAIARLPFPITILEYAAIGEALPSDVKCKTEKRIVVITDDGDKATIVPIIGCPKEFNNGRNWLYPGVFIQIEYDKEGDTTKFGYSEFCPDFSSRYDDDVKDAARSEWLAMSHGCLEAYLEFCEVMACSNVSYETIKAPEALNKARSKRGRPPIKDYHVLTIGGSGRNSCSHGDGSRQVRSHLRRGHIRRLQSGKRTWVNSCIVNGGADGFLDKDYKVSPRLYSNA